MARRRALAVALALHLATAAAAQDGAPSGRIADGARLLEGDTSAIASELAALEREHGVRAGVVTLARLDGADPKTVAVSTLNRWALGKRSFLLLVSVEPRKLYLQPGDELARKLDQPVASSICADVIAPRLRVGKAIDGLAAGLARARAVLAGRAELPAEAEPPARAPPSRGSPAAEVRDLAFYLERLRRNRVEGTLGDLFAAGFTLLTLILFWRLVRKLRAACPACGFNRPFLRSRLSSEPAGGTGEARESLHCVECTQDLAELFPPDTSFLARLIGTAGYVVIALGGLPTTLGVLARQEPRAAAVESALGYAVSVGTLGAAVLALHVLGLLRSWRKPCPSCGLELRRPDRVAAKEVQPPPLDAGLGRTEITFTCRSCRTQTILQVHVRRYYVAPSSSGVAASDDSSSSSSSSDAGSSSSSSDSSSSSGSSDSSSSSGSGGGGSDW